MFGVDLRNDSGLFINGYKWKIWYCKPFLQLRKYLLTSIDFLLI